MDNATMKAWLKTLFGDGYIGLFEYIDDDMIRKPAVRTQKMKEYENGEVDYKVTVNWRLVDKFFGGEK